MVEVGKIRHEIGIDRLEQSGLIERLGVLTRDKGHVDPGISARGELADDFLVRCVVGHGHVGLGGVGELQCSVRVHVGVPVTHDDGLLAQIRIGIKGR